MQARFAGFGQLVQGVGPAVGAPGCQRQRMGQPGPCLSKGGGSPLMASASRAQLVARPGAAGALWAGPAVVRGPYMGRCPIPHGHPSRASAGAVANAPRWPRNSGAVLPTIIKCYRILFYLAVFGQAGVGFKFLIILG